MLCLLASLATNAANHPIDSPTAWADLTANPSRLHTDDVITLSASISGGALVIPSSVTALIIEGNGNTLTARIQASDDLAALTLTLKNITVNGSPGQSTIRTAASLTLATEGTVTITDGSSNSAILVDGDFTITGGSPVFTATTGNYYAARVGGDLTISGSVAPTFAGGGGGMQLSAGNAFISTSGTTTFTSSSTNNSVSALRFFTDGTTMTLNGSGAVNVTGASRGIFSSGSLTIGGNGTGALNVTGGTGAGIYQPSGATLTLSKTGGGISIASTTGAAALESTDINISGAGTTVDVTGNIDGNLTVSDGTVTVSGTVSGTSTVTGGTVSINGATVTVPGAPANVSAIAGNGEAIVTFTAPASNGATITGYTVTAVEDGTKTATGAASPITVSGLTNGTAYTFTVAATNSVGKSLPSAASNSVTPFVPLTYTATISPETFPAATVGYGAQAEQVFTITNTGTGDLTTVQASLSTSDFEISTALSSATINAGGTGNTATVSVRPTAGLAVGTHTGTLAITGDNSLSITADLSFTVNSAAYGISVSSSTGGSVSANKASAAAGETVMLTAYPASGYELSAIRVHKTGDVSVSVGLNGFNGLNGSFTMPDYGVTVSASFSENLPPEPDPDAVALDGFIYAIRDLHVNVPQEEANTESTVADWLKAYLARLFEEKGWDISVQTLTVEDFVPATAETRTDVPANARTRTDVPGTNGSFSFFAMLKKGYVTERTYNMDGTVTATRYTTPTGNESAEASRTSVFFRNHTLYICSPVAETVEVYSFSGTKLFSAKKEAGEAGFTVLANLKAVIVRGSSGWTRKAINN
ncbi:hypothetical protein FACS1894181_11120 [Bacteroidia bacterium]|nr:hypothetical protein FACS1894181_11120 [Bacteroidia bacterium]